MRKLAVRLTRRTGQHWPVGTLAEDRGKIYFEYEESFIDRNIQLSPFHLPLEHDLFEHRDHQFGPLPGLFDDSLPDGWGLLLMDRHYRSLGIDLPQLSPLDRLAWLGDRTMGALTYHPPTEVEPYPETAFRLGELAQQAAQILAGSAQELLPVLLQTGGSPGGARPKVLVGFHPESQKVMAGAHYLPDGWQHWLVKFPGQGDSSQSGALEYAYWLMASAAGLKLPVARLFETEDGDRFFGVRRFDRGPDNRRILMHTFGNLIQANFRIPSADYADLLKVTSVLTRNHQDLLRTYRQMVFNVLAHNRDDHVKNFAYLLNDETGEWSLSPAYDLVFSHGPSGEHTMTVAGEGQNPGPEHFKVVADKAGISSKESEKIFAEVHAAITRWPEFADQAGVSGQAAEKVAKYLM